MRIEDNDRPGRRESWKSAETEVLPMHGVSKAFGPVEALRELDLRIAGGETTAINLMLGLLNPAAGSPCAVAA